MPPSPFLCSAALTAETLPADAPGTPHRSVGSNDSDNRFVLDEAKFMFDIGYVSPAARPENFAEYTRLLDELCGDTPVFIASPSPEFQAGEIEPLLRTLFQRSAA